MSNRLRSHIAWIARTALVIALPASLCTACLSIPISTIARMATFSDDDFYAIDPTEVRMRITSDKDSSLQIDKTKLYFEVQKRDGAVARVAGPVTVEREERLAPKETFLGLGYQARHIYVLKLNEQGIASFRSFQQSVKKRDLASVSISLEFDFETTEKATIVVDLMLSKREGYFTVLDKVKYPPDV